VAQNGSVVARLTADRATAEQVLTGLSECLDAADTACALFEEAGGDWTVEIHFRDVAGEAVVRALVATAAGPELAALLRFEAVATADWVAASLAGLTPVIAGRFVVHGAHDRARVAANRIGIEIEAALAFGTGHHGSTRGCLLAFDRLLKSRRPRRVLDIGTGTGVLAIAAARALRQRVLASDVDPQAVAVARANARVNRAGLWVEVVRADGLAHRRFRSGGCDLVFANILLGPLQRLARPIASVLAPHARVVLAGLLPEHANAALAAYRPQGVALERRLLVDGWVTLVLRRGRQRHRPGREPRR
jgi:ribosomal protein L11 methyltransferase